MDTMRQAACLARNVKSFLKKRPNRIWPDIESRIYKVTDATETLFICRPSRFSRSKNGILQGCLSLATQYHMHLLEIGEGDLIIDCGANVGELGKWAISRGAKYIGFEPEELEAKCAELNTAGAGAAIYKHGLWNSDRVLTFYRKPNSADSSFIEMNNYCDTVSVEVKRLDACGIDTRSAKRVILKVEAEGAEPEVLSGAESMLPEIDYVTVDCGFERGKENESTFIEVNRILHEFGFRIVAANFKRMTMLYENPSRAR